MTVLNAWTEHEPGALEAQRPAVLKAPAGSSDKMPFGN
jgi:hypothetical protein